mmetsp:Transcript_15552/g.29517  ORF Transcript_15552/g.29517 Transcript_15552/m.29517 type:complete len:537 (-) Transcript_15552:46-1656(-)|eukprot:CAMPEP_0197457474 /NCGR_PEP_ID=MMETSP1175-20131217/46145_1 /TAXON_ID=1003142 /ORGANISM="Triceratium dubium, Strain CCMP147" /LENGTH=536 /DNA_ID=CAMNT_0042991853 /DNA_START=70 /DNA_END=1680 /DNA_ORIENTATION=+
MVAPRKESGASGAGGGCVWRGQRLCFGAVICSLLFFVHIGNRSYLKSIKSHLANHDGIDRETCEAAIRAKTNPLLRKNAVPSMLSGARKRNVRDTMMKAVFEPDLVGDWVETGTWKGGASLIAAVTQRTAQETPACGQVRSRSIWLADSFEGLPSGADNASENNGYGKKMDPSGSYKFDGGVSIVKKLFQDHGFATDGSGPVSIRFLRGWFEDTLPDSTISNIAILRLDGDMYSSTLQALFALYRRVRIGGYVIIDDYGHWPQCKRAIDEFFADASIKLNKVDNTGYFFQKKNTLISVPHDWNKQIRIDPKVNDAFAKLAAWHWETERKFVGNATSNHYQTFRYIEGVRHVLQKFKDKGRINVCETGFNGGQNAMLFMAFHSAEVEVHYFGWDLGSVGSSHSIADNMSQAFNGRFNITWGNSKQASKDVSLGKDGKGQEQKCHLIVIDGQHSGPVVESNLTNLLPIAEPGALVFCNDCANYIRNIRKAPQMLSAWEKVAQTGKIRSVAHYRNSQLQLPGFVEGVVPGPNGDYELVL